MHVAVERRQAHPTSRQVSPSRQHTPGARRYLRLTRHTAALHRGLFSREELLDQLVLVGCSRLPGRDRSYEREDVYEETNRQSADLLQTENLGEREAEQKRGVDGERRGFHVDGSRRGKMQFDITSARLVLAFSRSTGLPPFSVQLTSKLYQRRTVLLNIFSPCYEIRFRFVIGKYICRCR